MKNLAIGFASIRPAQYSEEICNFREQEYFLCIRQILNILPESFDFILCENTIDDGSQLKNLNLRNLLDGVEICAMGSKSNIGQTNKGIGELLQLKTALDQTDIKKYENISYVTTRGFLTCPYVFEKTEQFKEQALLSNPDFIWLNGRVATATDGLFNDQFFSMKSDVMKQYSDYSMDRLDALSSNHISSEINLFNFVKENNISYQKLKWLGRIRNDWSSNNNPFDGNNFHVC